MDKQQNKCFYNLELISVTGMWSTWDGWSACSKTCNAGERTRYRTCKNLRPDNSGAYSCDGTNFENENCIQQTCPITSKSTIAVLSSFQTKVCNFISPLYNYDSI